MIIIGEIDEVQNLTKEAILRFFRWLEIFLVINEIGVLIINSNSLFMKTLEIEHHTHP